MNETDDKLTRILDAASDLFAHNPFHKVLLSDVARKAAVGKGTLYLYFDGKDDLYFGVLFRGFTTLVEQLEEFLDGNESPADEQMTGLIEILTRYLYSKAINMELLGRVMTCPVTDQWRDKRLQLWGLVEQIIQKGIQDGVFKDSNPRLSAQYIPALLRSTCIFKPDGEDADSISRHAAQFVLGGLLQNGGR